MSDSLDSTVPGGRVAAVTSDKRGLLPSGPGDIDRRRAALIVAAIAAGFTLLYGFLALRRLHLFQMHAFDLGIFDQGLWLLSRFENPFVTIRGLNLFADHTSFVMVLLTPLYWLWSDVRMLIGFTAVVIAAGIPLTFLVARAAGLSRRWSVVAAAAYALHPAAAWNVRDSFHPEVLAIPLLLAAMWCLLRHRPALAMTAVGLVLLTKEDAGLVIVPFGLYVALVMRQRIGWWIAAGGAAAFVLAFSVILPGLSPTGDLLYTARYGHLGTGLSGILWGLVTRPQDWLPDLFTFDRLEYLAALILPLPVALLAPRFLLIAVPTLLANVLSQHVYQFDIQYHYTAYVLPVVVVAAVLGIPRFQQWTFPRLGPRILPLILAVAIAGHVAAAPFPLGFRHAAWTRATPQIADHHEALTYLPDDVIVSASSGFVTHLSQRDEIYLFPTPWQRYNYAVPGTVLPDAFDVEWVITRLDVPADHLRVLDAITISSFETVYRGENVVVLRRLP